MSEDYTKKRLSSWSKTKRSRLLPSHWKYIPLFTVETLWQALPSDASLGVLRFLRALSQQEKRPKDSLLHILPHFVWLVRLFKSHF
mmetsp:Transcript_49065/g.96741  ORF Transcript_49065/g.96741 Transcript_49065/m.96741 type:complete len:86 (+) Transcript_49065:1129-1386(+)